MESYKLYNFEGVMRVRATHLTDQLSLIRLIALVPAIDGEENGKTVTDRIPRRILPCHS